MELSISKPVLIAFLVVFFAQSAAIIGYFFLDSDKPQAATAGSKIELIADERNLARSPLQLPFVGTDEENPNNTNESDPNAKTEELFTEPLEAKPLTSEQIAVQQEAANNVNSLFDNAFAVGKWEQKDTFALLEHLGDLSEEDTHLLRERFHTAFNGQELELESIPPL